MQLKLFLSIIFYFSISILYGQRNVEKIDNLFKKYHNEEGFAGAVLVADKGEVIYKKGFGLANQDWGISNQPDTKFDIASISKQFTAAVILMLAEEGKIDLEGKISDYLPYFRKDYGKKVTIHHLLTHRSGIPNYTSIPYVWEDSLKYHYKLKDLITKFCSRDLEFEPGTSYEYNNSGYVILAAIIETACKDKFANILNERLFKPLNMNSTGVDVREMVIPKRATGYIKQETSSKPADYMYMGNLVGAGNLYSTVEDLFKWDQALYSNEILSASAKAKMIKSYSKGSSWILPFENGYGYGVGTANVGGKGQPKVNLVFHSGHISGYSSYLARFTDNRNTVIILSNTGSMTTTGMNLLAVEVNMILSESNLQKTGTSGKGQ
ncbi:serine hydrolase domain-containing protein [Flexithrix dorotheae]|uniref:serine hydrolase domain-containing protein n=1 Tax=Flexithrix dorotheae TaxID=70993 RepID=UPI00036136BB|nr:serine hydrolase domain-containing protein [Flexithrix dorotheae]